MSECIFESATKVRGTPKTTLPGNFAKGHSRPLQKVSGGLETEIPKETGRGCSRFAVEYPGEMFA